MSGVGSLASPVPETLCLTCGIASNGIVYLPRLALKRGMKRGLGVSSSVQMNKRNESGLRRVGEVIDSTSLARRL
jgi:hypothetical protein